MLVQAEGRGLSAFIACTLNHAADFRVRAEAYSSNAALAGARLQGAREHDEPGRNFTFRGCHTPARLYQKRSGAHPWWARIPKKFWRNWQMVDW
jgi:hypothetical protein